MSYLYLITSSIVGSVQDSLLSTGIRIVDDASSDCDSGFVKILIAVCLLLCAFVGWLVITLVKANIAKSSIISNEDDTSNCKLQDNTMGFIVEIRDRMDKIDDAIDSLSLWMQKKNSEDVSKDQRLRIMRSKVMGVLDMFYDKDMRAFVVAKSTMFIGFILENMEVIKQDNGYCLFEQMFVNKAEESFGVAMDIIGHDKAKCFYDNIHNKSVKEYLVSTKKIYEDETNDKINRLFNLSILFMQEFISQLNKIQDKTALADSFVNDEGSDLAKEFKRLESMFKEKNKIAIRRINV